MDQTCSHCRLGRRDFIRLSFGAAAGAATFANLGLAWPPAFAEASAGRQDAKGKAKAVILLWMQGAPSQLDTFDPKPGTDTGGPFKAIDTAVPGIRICEHLPRLAKQMKKFSIIRTLNSRDPNHDTAAYLLHTGYRRSETVDHPHFGSIVTNELGMPAEGLPGCVTIGGDDGIGSGYLPQDRTPFIVEKMENPLEDLKLAAGVTKYRLDDREALLNAQNQRFAKEHDERKVEAHLKAYERALALIRSPHVKAFDVSHEPEAVRKLYGSSNFGKACLMARRLVQAGTRFVEVRLADWDTHADNFNRTQKLMGDLDPGFAGLLEDLDRTGMLSETLVLWMGEFGRTPRVNAANGRDHFTRAWSVAMAGAGLQGGRVVGATNKEGTEVAERPVPVVDYYATLYECLGIDTKKQFTTSTGRPVKILDEGSPVKELLS